METIKKEAEKRRFKLQEEPTVFLSPDNKDISAYVPFTKTFLGVYSSNARRRALTFFGGMYDKEVRTAIPLNSLSMGGAGGRKLYNHSILDDVNEAMDWLQNSYFDKICSRLKTHKYTKEKTEHLLLTASRDGIMPWSRIKKIDEKIENKDVIAWDLLVAFAQVTSMNPAMKRMDQTLNFYRILEKDLDLTKPEAN